MKYKYLITNTQILQVFTNPDGTLLLTKDGINSIPNAGHFIVSAGGKESLLARCVELDMCLEEVIKMVKEERTILREQRQISFLKFAEKHNKKIKDDFDRLMTLNIIDTTEENVAIILRYFNSMNWGVWPKLPKMSVSYKINQYSTSRGSNTATAISFKDGRKFAVGCGPRDLPKYVHLI